MCRRTLSAFAVLIGLVVLTGLGVAASDDTPEPATGPDRGALGRLATARDAFKAIDQMRVAGQHIDSLKHYVWSRRLMEAEREIARTRADRIAAARAHLDRIEKLMKDIKLQYEHAEVSQLEFLDTQYHYNEAVSSYEKEKAE